jgi:putative transposase
VVTAAHLDRMEEAMGAVCRDFGCVLAEFNGEAERVHLLVRFPPTVALSRLSTASRASPPGGCGRSSQN